jgi:hypothetical protein
MSSFYSNLAQEDTKNTKNKKQMKEKNAIVLKTKSQKRPKKPNFKKAVIAGG